MILGVTGTNGAGKGTVVDYLETRGFKHYSVRGELIREIERRGLVVDRSSMRDMGNELRAKFGAGYFINLFTNQAKEEGISNSAIESIRSVGEVAALQELGGVLIAVDADRPTRYERAVVRGSDTDKVDFETWVFQEEREWNNKAAYDMNIPAVLKMADYTILNNGTLSELHAKIEEVLTKIAK